ncbi:MULTISPECIES: hypothetical protein [Streptomyces]|uniref:hypothetical protein n=1 Tax=Streptomyces TaxID=1883 RepID=UPI00142D2381|nr:MULTISPECIES: hypothetical protein [Streptomyces]
MGFAQDAVDAELGVFQIRGDLFRLFDLGRDHNDSGAVDPFWYATEKPDHSS